LRRAFGKRRGPDYRPIQRTCPDNFFDPSVLGKYVAENERAQDIFEQRPVKRNHSG
jgi:hypothetical protein